MTEAKHTPGPWSIHQIAETAVVGGTGFIVAACGGHSNNMADPDELNAELVANAQLIAAAPELISIAQRWAALDGGAWHVARHAQEKADLTADTAAVIVKALGSAA